MKRQIALRASTPVNVDAVVRAYEHRVENHELLPDAFTVVLGDGKVSRHVDVLVGASRRNKSGVTCDIAVRAKRRARAFPRLQGTFVIRGTAAGDTDLWLLAEYEHPLGPIGAVGSTIGGAHLARASVETMFRTMVDELVGDAERGEPTWRPAPSASPLVHRSALG